MIFGANIAKISLKLYKIPIFIKKEDNKYNNYKLCSVQQSNKKQLGQLKQLFIFVKFAEFAFKNQKEDNKHNNYNLIVDYL